MLSWTEFLGEGSLNFRVDAIRLGLFVGWFSGAYKAILATCRYTRQHKDGWNAFTAGSLSGLAILWMEKPKRKTWALYLFVRALQCAYYGAKSRGWWHFWGSSWPHGDSLLFAVSSAQVHNYLNQRIKVNLICRLCMRT